MTSWFISFRGILNRVLFRLYYWYLFIYKYRSTIYRSIDRDKQEKKEAESRRKVDKVELVL